MPKHVPAGLMFGHPLTIPVPDLDRTDYLLMLGANPLESNGALHRAGLPRPAQGAAQARRPPGRRRPAPYPHRRARRRALFVRPGTDADLLFGIAHALIAEKLDESPLAGERVGSRWTKALAAFAPRWCADALRRARRAHRAAGA